MSSAGASSPIFRAVWSESCDQYRFFEADYPNVTFALMYQLFPFSDCPWIFDPVFCSDCFRPRVMFEGGPLAGQHSYPLDITVLTDTDDDLPF